MTTLKLNCSGIQRKNEHQKGASQMAEAEYKFGNATVRIHGSVNHEKLVSATEKFMKKVLLAKRREQKGAEKNEI